MVQPVRKTKLMQRVERERGESLEILLPKLLEDGGTSEAAAYLGVSSSTVNYWMLRFRLEVRRVVEPWDRSE